VSSFFLLPFAAGFCSLLLAVVSLVRRKPTFATWWFFAGMLALALDSIFTGLSLRAAQSGDVIGWLTPAFVAECFVPVLWLGFSLTYARTNHREFVSRWKFALLAFGVLPLAMLATLVMRAPAVRAESLWWLQSGPMAAAVNVVFLVALVLVLTNMELTFRSAVGTMRWRIKFVVVALAIILGARLYIRGQAILFSAPDTAFWSIEASALLVGCFFLAIAHARTGLAEIDVYPSLAVLRSSLTLLVVGAYLVVVGVLAQVVARFGGAEIFQFQALVVIVGMAGLAVLLLSERARQRLQTFVGRHFSKAQHDSVRMWTLFSKRLGIVSDQAGLCGGSAKLISETFDVLSVTIWLVDEEKDRLTVKASTAPSATGAEVDTASSTVVTGLRGLSAPFDLEQVSAVWGDEFRQLNPTTFASGGSRWCVPLHAGDSSIGVIVLADRVNAAVYTIEELELLRCIGDQVTSVLLNLRLASEVARARELDAFRVMSAFFVHDLKNAAASLNLMLKNLPVHFDDPAFRADALRSIGNTAKRIDDMIARLSAIRQRPEALRVEADLNQLVNEALDKVNDMPNVQLTKDLEPLPPIVADREQIQSVVTNLVLNARDALGSQGMIQVRTQNQGRRVLLSVKDNGCGMTPAFLKESLFQPFQSTKKKGLGIGLFQARAIVQAHGGGMHVESELGKGTTFRVTLPVKHER
jgi:putative PEP-CTERM system histidine kinase